MTATSVGKRIISVLSAGRWSCSAWPFDPSQSYNREKGRTGFCRCYPALAAHGLALQKHGTRISGGVRRSTCSRLCEDDPSLLFDPDEGHILRSRDGPQR